MKKIKIQIQKNNVWFYPAVVIFILAVGVVSTFYTYTKVSQSIKTVLLQRVGTIAGILELDKIQSLTGTEKDLQNPVYNELKNKLIRTREINADVRFIYILGYREGDPFFYIDSELKTSPDLSPPGQVYAEASQKLRHVFSSREPIVEGISSDRWGNWLTALYPINEFGVNIAPAVIGMDIDASQYTREIIIYSSFPAAFCLLLLLLVIFFYTVKKEEAKRLSLWSELLSVVSHEVRSPLNGILWAMDGLVKKTVLKLNKTEAHTLYLIKDSCASLLKTVNYFLDIYSLEDPKKSFVASNVNLTEVIRSSISGFELLAEKKQVEIEFKANTEAVVWGDADKLKRMLNNLISNAIKYSKASSKVNINVMENELKYVFSIADNGIGIPEEDQIKIFEGLYRSENAKGLVDQGTGLGLYYVRQVVEIHRGRIWLKSKPGEGTTFFIELPKVA